ncbi:MAG: nucleoside monophosphate kinase [bacterium]|nr:nucleoside monophosphate kinase [bacterium]
MSKIISIYGLPAAGKTTQAELLAKEFGFIQFGMGDRLRAEIESGSALGQEIKKYVDEGILIPDELMSQVIQSVGAEIKDKGIVFDGFPRILSQAEMLRVITTEIGMDVDAFFYLHISPEEALRRIAARSQDGGREDDKDASAVKNRMDVFNTQSTSLKDYYGSRGKLVEIDGELSIEEVYAEIKKHL